MMNISSTRLYIVADRRAQFEQIEYTDDEYQKELEHIEQVILLIHRSLNLL